MQNVAAYVNTFKFKNFLIFLHGNTYYDKSIYNNFEFKNEDLVNF